MIEPEDPRVTALLGASRLWREIDTHETVTSTQDVALQALNGGRHPGFVVSADRQSAGRGRGGRTWRDAVGGPHGPGSLAVTATVPTPEVGAELVPLVTGLAVAGTYRRAGAVPQLKWPNDVLLDGRKAAGILVERHVLGDGVDVLLVGCGLDLDWRGVARDGDAAAWTSLAEHLAAGVDRTRILVDLLDGLERALRCAATSPDELLRAYRADCSTIGAEVRVGLPGGRELVGRASDVDRGGRLLVEAGGTSEVVTAGDVVHVRPA